MDVIAAIMFEPVGCLAEFRSEEFNAAARELFQSSADEGAGGSAAYWRLLALIDAADSELGPSDIARLEEFELAAVARAEFYEDVVASLETLRSCGVRNYLVSSLSRRAIDAFMARFSLENLFDGVTARDGAQGVLASPLRRAIAKASLAPGRVIYLVDTADALEMAKGLEVNAVLMINDYDEGRVLAERSPAGGIVSLAELPRALELIEQRAGLTTSKPMPRKPFELFECD